MANTPGHMWIEGTKLHYIDADGDERAEEGTDTTANGTAGYIWIEGDAIHYIDANGDERYLPYEHVGADSAVEGQTWVEGNWVHYTAQTDADEKIWHTDDDHGDTAHSDDPGHTDNWSDYDKVWHTDTAHSNDPPHTDTGFTQAPHSQYSDVVTYTDHQNWGHTDDHTDNDPGHTDTYADHNNSVHADTAHSDDPPHTDDYIDGEHSDLPDLV